MESTFAERLARVADRWTLQLTHYGRKTGNPYLVTIWFIVEGETIYLTTMSMKRQWPRNVQARPAVRLEIGGETFHGRAELVSTPADREHVGQLARQKYWIMWPVDLVVRLTASVLGRDPREIFKGGFFRVRLDPA